MGERVRERAKAVDSGVCDIEDKLAPLARAARAAHRMAQDTYNRAENTENRLHRNNIHIVGLSVKSEGKDPTIFVENWLVEIFGREAFSPFFTVERAHRVPGRPPHREPLPGQC